MKKYDKQNDENIFGNNSGKSGELKIFELFSPENKKTEVQCCLSGTWDVPGILGIMVNSNNFFHAWALMKKSMFSSLRAVKIIECMKTPCYDSLRHFSQGRFLIRQEKRYVSWSTS
jgi:hypothetical protein